MRNYNKDLTFINKFDKKPKMNTIERTEEMEETRKELPIAMHENDILESIENNLVTVICGETGSGKST
jgi:HrpA-like RNA helicase